MLDTDHKLGIQWSKIPRDIRIFAISRFSSVGDCLHLRCASKLSKLEHDESVRKIAYSAYSSHIYRSERGARWIIANAVNLRSFTLVLPNLPNGMTTLYWLCEHNHADIASLVFHKAPSGVNDLSQVLSDGSSSDVEVYVERTAFYVACLRGHYDIVCAGLDCASSSGSGSGSGGGGGGGGSCCAVDVMHPNNHGWSPFSSACAEGHTHVVRAMLNHPNRNQIDINRANSIGVTPLYAAAGKGHVEVVRLLIEDDRTNVNICSKDGIVPICAASYHGHKDVVSALLALPTGRIDVNVADISGCNSLYGACGREFPEIVRMLLADGRVNVNQANINAWTPLYTAADNGHTDIVQLLLSDHRVDVNASAIDGCSPLCAAAGEGHTEVVRLLLARPDILANRSTADGWTPLCAAASKGYIDIVTLLLADSRVDVLHVTADGVNAFLISVEQGHTEVAELLFESMQLLDE